MSTEDDNLFEQELPLYNETPKPLILKKAEDITPEPTDPPPNTQVTTEKTLRIKDTTERDSHSDLIIRSDQTTQSSGLKIKSSSSHETPPTLLIKKANSETNLESSVEISEPTYEDSTAPIEEANNFGQETNSTTLYQENTEQEAPPINSMDGELFSGTKPKASDLQAPHNSDSIKNLEENDPVPEPSEHSPRTIILRNKPLPGDEGKLSLTSVEIPEEDQNHPSFSIAPPPHIQELEEYEEVLNTAAQESVFELSPNELEADSENEEDKAEGGNQQDELFEKIHSEENEPRHIKNSPTIYEMEDDSSIGTMLMSARQKASYTIKELARRTNIKEAYIIALEEENRSNLPDPIYTKSYIKNLSHELRIEYPKALKLYADLCGEEFDTQYNIAQKGPDKYASKPASSTLQKWSAIFVIVLILGLITVGFTAKHFYSPAPVFKAEEQVNLNNFHQEVSIPIPRLKVPNK